jgi:two-component system sensor histidine kinase DesK
MVEQTLPSLSENKNIIWVWAPLFFSIFYFLPFLIVIEHFTTKKIVISLLIYASFIHLYIKIGSVEKPKALPLIITLLTLCILGTWATSGTQALFGYSIFFIAYFYTIKQAVVGFFIVITCIFLTAYGFNLLNGYFIFPPIIISTGMFFFGIAVKQDKIHQQKEAISQKKIQQFATIAERERIARDIHDIVGHTLTSIALKADLAEQLANAGKHKEATEQIQEVAHLSRNTLSEVRAAVTELKNQKISHILNEISTQFSLRNVNLTTNVFTPELPSIIETNLGFIIKESATNILRHSQGDKVIIELMQD